MNEILNKIFENVIAHEDIAVKTDQKLDLEVKRLVEPYRTRFSESDMEVIKEVMYAILTKSEKEGFKLGVRFTIKILMESLVEL